MFVRVADLTPRPSPGVYKHQPSDLTDYLPALRRRGGQGDRGAAIVMPDSYLPCLQGRSEGSGVKD